MKACYGYNQQGGRGPQEASARHNRAPSARTRRGRPGDTMAKGGHHQQQNNDDIVKRHVPVCEAVWAELMRTRFSSSPTESALCYLQEASRCNAHIDRTCYVVHLGGRHVAVQLAQVILLRIAACTKKDIITGAALFFDEDELIELGAHFEVTFVKDDNHVAVLGLAGRVKIAAQHLMDQVRFSNGPGVQYLFKMDPHLVAMFELSPMTLRTATTKICERQAAKLEMAKARLCEAVAQAENPYESCVEDSNPPSEINAQSLSWMIKANGLPCGAPAMVDPGYCAAGGHYARDSY